MKSNKKYFEFFFVFYLNYKGYELSQYSKLLQKCIWKWKKLQCLENFELWYGSIFLNETFSIDLSLILKNNQPELDGHGHHFMHNMPIFQKWPQNLGNLKKKITARPHGTRPHGSLFLRIHYFVLVKVQKFLGYTLF